MATLESIQQRLNAVELERWATQASEFAKNIPAEESRLLDQGYILFFKTFEGENPVVEPSLEARSTTFSLSEERFRQFRECFNFDSYSEVFEVSFKEIRKDDDYKRESYNGEVVIANRSKPDLTIRIGLSYRQQGGDWINNERLMVVQTPVMTILKNGRPGTPEPFFKATEFQTLQLLTALAKKYSDHREQLSQHTDLGGRDYA